MAECLCSLLPSTCPFLQGRKERTLQTPRAPRTCAPSCFHLVILSFVESAPGQHGGNTCRLAPTAIAMASQHTPSSHHLFIFQPIRTSSESTFLRCRVSIVPEMSRTDPLFVACGVVGPWSEKASSITWSICTSKLLRGVGHLHAPSMYSRKLAGLVVMIPGDWASLPCLLSSESLDTRHGLVGDLATIFRLGLGTIAGWRRGILGIT